MSITANRVELSNSSSENRAAPARVDERRVGLQENHAGRPAIRTR